MTNDAALHNYSSLRDVRAAPDTLILTLIFLMGGGGGGRGVVGLGLRRGGLLVIFLQIGEGQTCFIRNRGRVTVFFDKEKITPCRLVDSFVNKHAKCIET